MTETNFQKRSRTFKVGITIVIFFSAVIGFFNIAVLYWFGVPILGLLAGIIAVWFSVERIKTKILSTLLPLPVILVFFFLFYLLLPKAEPETFLIPQNFRGQIEIVFGETCGQSIVYEKDRRIYRIPDNGVLIINAKQMMGVIDRKFYLIYENGNETELPEFHWSKFEEEKNDWHWTFSNTKLSKDLVGVMWNPSVMNYEIFIINDYQTLEKENKEESRKSFYESADKLLKECRQTR